jgi:large exoprotein involved in heme utilization and adhesion
VGNGGKITIDTGSLSIQAGANIATVTTGQGNAGNVTIKASNNIVLNSADIVSTMEGVGNGGNIAIATNSLTLSNGATLSASTFGIGNAGNVTVDTTNNISLVDKNTSVFTSVETGAIGTGGRIAISSGSLSVRDNAQLVAATAGTGNAGTVNIKVRAAAVFSGANTAIFSTVEPGAIGTGGNISIEAGSLSIANGAQFLSSTAGKGDAGNTTVKVTGNVDIVGRSNGFFSEIRTIVDKNAIGNGGSITIDAGAVSLRNGAQLQTATFGRGNAGNVTVRVADTFTLTGTGTAIFSNVEPGGIGKSGNISIDAANSILLSGAGGAIVAAPSSQGIAGDILLSAPQIVLDNGAILNANSLSGNGGNITIGITPAASGLTPRRANDLLILRHGAKISTNANGTPQQGGNGGNIDINSQFIVAIPTENSDITANAVKGSGGNVNINSQGLFGIQFRPQQTSFSDITVSSDFGQSGNISINTPGIDPGKNISELPTIPTDASTQISQACSSNQLENKFYITGRGGHPSNLEDLLVNEAIWLDDRQGTTQPSATTRSNQPSLRPAVGWVIDRTGKVTLIAASTEGETASNRLACPHK